MQLLIFLIINNNKFPWVSYASRVFPTRLLSGGVFFVELSILCAVESITQTFVIGAWACEDEPMCLVRC